MRLEVPVELAEDVGRLLPGREGLGVVGTQGACAALGDPAELAQGVGGVSGAAEGESDLVPAGEGVGVVGAERLFALGGDGPVDVTRFLPVPQAPEVESGSVAGRPGWRAGRERERDRPSPPA